MARRLLFRLLTLAALVTTALSASAYDFYADGFYFNITGENTVSVTHREQYSTDYSGAVTIPSSVTYGGVNYTVTGIGRSAFYDCTEMTSVNIPTTVTKIENSAFYYCTALTSVFIPESVTTIGEWNFFSSDELTTVTLPSTLQSIGDETFSSCAKLTKVTCRAKKPPVIGSYCFASVSTKSLYVPADAMSIYQADSNWSSPFSTVNEMPEYDFTSSNLKYRITSYNTAMCLGSTIASPSGNWRVPSEASYQGVNYMITAVGDRAFFQCSNITTIILGNNVETVGVYAFYGCTSLTNLNLGHVKTLKDCAFGDCRGLTQVTIPNTVTSIGVYGFGGCGLTSVLIPASVQFLGERIFYSCTSLENIYVEDGNPNYVSDSGVLLNKARTELLVYPIGRPSTSFTVDEGITSIALGAFGYSQYLQRVVLPSSLTSIDYLAFAYNSALTEVYCEASTPPTVMEYAFVSTIENSGLTLSVPRDSKSAYEAADVWRDFPNIVERCYDFRFGLLYYNITGENTVEVTCDNPNGGTYDSYSMIDVPSTAIHGKFYTVTAIGDKAFSECYNLPKVVLPSTIKTIGWMAFYNCYKLTEINLPENLTTIENYAFYSCSSLANVEIPASVTWLGYYAFCHCSSLTEVYIPNSVKTINYGAFYACTNLAKITIGGGVTSIGDRAFYDCTELTTIICNATTPPYINSGTFLDTHYSNAQLFVPKGTLSAYQSADYWRNFTNITEMNCDFEQDGIYYNIISTNPARVEVTYLTSNNNNYNNYSGEVNIPETVTHGGTTYTVTAIGAHAFDMCKSLTAVTIPNTVTNINDYAFHYCQSLTSIDIPNSVTRIGNEAFWLCMELEEVIIPNSVTTVGGYAFRNCTALGRVVIGENVTSIGLTSFYYCPYITEVICLATTPPTLYDSGTNTTFMPAVYQNAVLRVPYGSHDAYRNHSYWGKFVNIVSEAISNPALAGDMNNDGNVTVSDVTALISLVLSGNANSNPAADVNGDGNANIADATMLINRLLSGQTGEVVGTGYANYLINGHSFKMIKVDGGTFMMGVTGDASASPVHQVTVSDFYIAQTEVTQDLWQAVMGSNPSSNQSLIYMPAENMDWNDCQTFAAKMFRLTGRNFRLPTEAEWEFAARGGNKSNGYTYAGSNTLNDVAWYAANSGNTIHAVGTKAPNELGIYDMSGNVFEWCQDFFDNYTSSAQVDPQGPSTGEYRVCRGSSYCRNTSPSDWFKCGSRTFDSPDNPASDTGMRLACDAF